MCRRRTGTEGRSVSLSAGDLAIVKEIAYEVSNIMKEDIKETIQTAIEKHTLTCPATKNVSANSRVKPLLLGAVAGAALAGGGSNAGSIAKWLSTIL